ncbi:MAG TPA: MFS transporter [Acetobacteraceae bacterium]|nr:MFS transporter [Acetobacteraceae bacterium]
MIAVWLPLLALFLIRLVPGIAFQSVAVAAPVLMAGLGISHAQVGLLLGGFMLPGIVVTVPAGLLARRVGDRRVIGGGLLLIVLGAAAASQVGSVLALLITRVLAGLGGPSVLMLLIKMTTDRYGGALLSTALATILAAWPAGLALGLLLLGPVPAALGWQATLGLAAIPAAAALLLLPLIGRAPDAAAVTVAPRTTALPVVLILAAVLSWSCVNAVLAIVVSFLPGYFVALGRSVDGAAAATSVMAWTFAGALPFGGLLADLMLGRRVAVIVGCLATAGLLAVVVATGGPLVALFALGLVFALVPGPLTAQLGQATPPTARAMVFGWYSAGSYAAMAVAPWAAGWLRDASADARSPLVLAAALILAALVSYAIMDGAATVARRASYRGAGAARS